MSGRTRERKVSVMSKVARPGSLISNFCKSDIDSAQGSANISAAA